MRYNASQIMADAVRLVLTGIALTILILLLTGCTLVHYADQDGRELLALDLRLAGSAVDIEVTRPDGTVVSVTRDQGSPENTIEAIGDSVNPLPGLR